MERNLETYYNILNHIKAVFSVSINDSMRPSHNIIKELFNNSKKWIRGHEIFYIKSIENEQTNLN